MHKSIAMSMYKYMGSYYITVAVYMCTLHGIQA